MVFALLLLPIAAVLGYINHRSRIRSLEREFNARISDQSDEHTSRGVDTDRNADEFTEPDRARSRLLVSMLDDLREPLTRLKTPLLVNTEIEGTVDLDDYDVKRMLDNANRLQHNIDRIQAVLESDLDSVGFEFGTFGHERTGDIKYKDAPGLRVEGNPFTPCEVLAQAPENSSDPESYRDPEDYDASEKESTVLIVDDHPGTRGYLAYAISKHHNVIEAANGAEALRVIKTIQPDLVISDIMMPVMDGNELCRAIKLDGDLNHIPIFLVTANTVPELKKAGLESGADDYLLKPFDLDEALMRINNEIRSRTDLRRRFSRQVVIKPSNITVTSADEAFLSRARDLVEEHIDDGNFGVQEFASEFAMSSRQLQRRLRETVDKSPVEFIRMLRLQRAAQLLEGHFGNVSEVAYSVGFTSLSYFAKCFREQFDTSPSEFKSRQAA